jgi:hypothetical protein
MVKQAGPRWNAVSVVPAAGGCEAARSLKGQRFLSADAPRLPLPQCSSPMTCQCVYKKYADRRAGPRREAEKTGLHRAMTSGQERRARRGRRSTDLSDE